MIRHLVAVVALVAVAVWCGSDGEATVAAEPLRVLSSNGVKAVIENRRADLEHAAGQALSVEFSTAASLGKAIEAGEACDVAILTAAMMDDLASEGRIVADSRHTFARTGVGVGARKGAPAADVGTLEALKTTLLGARSVAFTADGQSRVTIDRAFGRLGIADAMRAKTVLKGPGEAPTTVARGEAELVLTLISEIVPVSALQFVGPFPAELQSYVSFTAGMCRHAKNATAADAFLRHLSTAAFADALKAHGLEAVGR